MWDVRVLETCLSTQDEVRGALAEPSENLPCVRTCDQPAGRGRRGRVWQFQTGDLAFSFAVKPDTDKRHWPSLSLLAGLAMVQVLDVSGAHLKWPNDIMLNGKKAAGILCEIEHDYVIIGIGVNLTERDDDTVSVFDVPHDAGEVMGLFLSRFQALYRLWSKMDLLRFRMRGLIRRCQRGWLYR